MAIKILVIDDESDLCALMKTCLESTGDYQVRTTSLPEEVMDLCLSFQPDLILLDIVMPQMSGREIIDMLKGNPQTRKIRIIVTSGGGEMVYSGEDQQWSWQPNQPLVVDRDDVIKERRRSAAAEAYGVDDFLAKPFPPSVLIQVVNEVIERKTEED